MWLGLASLLFGQAAAAKLTLVFSEHDADNLAIEVVSDDSRCAKALLSTALFAQPGGITQLPDGVFLQRLNSEKEDARYLKAARHGGGIYVHLPYFMPAVDCGEVSYQFRARHILMDGSVRAGHVDIASVDAQDKSVFFTNEAMPNIAQSVYVDPQIAGATATRLRANFEQVIAYYKDVLHLDPMRNIGVVMVVVRNNGGYFGFGGDSLNIIRLAMDNPRPQDLEGMDLIFLRTFAHEIAHKVQSEKLFGRPYSRYMVEGGADFLRLQVLRETGLLTPPEAKEMALKAVNACADKLSDKTVLEKIKARQLNYREPYDCGLAYYLAAYYDSQLPMVEFLPAFLSAATGNDQYSSRSGTLCLLFEATCANTRLTDLLGDKAKFLAQKDWLEVQISAH